MLLFVAVAHAHPATVPHLHATDPAGVALVAFWVLAGVVLLVRALNMPPPLRQQSAAGTGSDETVPS